MDCLLAAVFAARSGAIPLDDRMIHPPPELDGRARSYLEKGLLGEAFPYHVETANFAVQWTDPSVDAARADAIGEVLERAWTAMVVDGGWTPPVSSDRYLLNVILDPGVAGSGYTTEYPTDEFPQGYPVTYLQPTYYEDEYPGYALSVAAHEFGHMLQFAVAEHDPSQGQTWYWEATSEWQAERSVPEIDTYALSSFWYARDPGLAFDSIVNGHPYGMVLLNAYLDEYVIGLDGIRDVWNAAGPDWDELIAARAGTDFTTVMHGFVGAYGAEALRESALYDRPADILEYDRTPWAETLSLPDTFGTTYLEITEYDPDVGVQVSGPVDWVAIQDGQWDGPLHAGAVLFAATAIGEGTSFSFGTALEDSGVDSGGDSGDKPGSEPDPQRCGCGGPGQPGAWIAAAALIGLRRRRGTAIVRPLPGSPA